MGTLTLGYCGLNCAHCPVFRATAANNDDLRQETAKEWSDLYRKYLKKELCARDMQCRGCRSDADLFIGARDCPIRECCRGRKFTTCAGCHEYTTCEMLNGFFTFHQNAKTNLEEMRTM